MSEPLVSILVNNYNYGRFLRAAIDSALTQTYQHCEIIVVDDGSTDDSGDIIRSYGNRIRPVMKSNGGQGSAFNAGLDVARGSLIAFLDSDDIFLPEKVETCVRIAAEHPSSQFIYHQVQTVNAEGSVRGKLYPTQVQCGLIAPRVQRDGGSWTYAPTSGQFVRREFLEHIFPVPEASYPSSADAYVACLAGMLVEVTGIPTVLTYYRAHGTNAWLSGGGVGREERLRYHIRRFEIESDGLNKALQRLGSPKRVRLQDHFAYHLCLWQAGRLASFWQLLWLTARDPSQSWVRFRTMGATGVSLLRTKRGQGSALETT